MAGLGSLVKGGVNMLKGSGGKSAAKQAAKEGMTSSPSLMSKVGDAAKTIAGNPMAQRAMLATGAGVAGSKITSNNMEETYEEQMNNMVGAVGANAAAQGYGPVTANPGGAYNHGAVQTMQNGGPMGNHDEFTGEDPGIEDEDSGGFKKKGGFLKTVAAGGVGAVLGGMKKFKDSDSENMAGKMMDAGKGLFAGGSAGVLSKMSYDGIQDESGGFKAGAAGGMANMAASLLNDDPDGPSMMGSALTGFGAGTVGNLVHDKLTEHGHDKMADAAGYGLQGLSLGRSSGALSDAMDFAKDKLGIGGDWAGKDAEDAASVDKSVPGSGTAGDVIGELSDRLGLDGDSLSGARSVGKEDEPSL